jgi:hypothetical protein
MATVSRPRNITAIAEAHGLTTAEVRTLIDAHGMPTYRLGNSRLVDPDDQPGLERLIRRLIKNKAKARGAAVST